MKNEQEQNWTKFYHERISEKVYPREWCVRIFMGGNYPGLKLSKKDFVDAKILDLGCGDGRNIEFLSNLGFSVYATEIKKEIVQSLVKVFSDKPLTISFEVAKAHCLPYSDSYFDYILASSSCNYLEEGINIDKNLSEIARVLKPNGIFVGTLPMVSSDLFKGSIRLQDGSYLITSDPQNLRNGYRLHAVHSEKETEDLLVKYFENITLGFQKNNFFGEMLDFFIFVCNKPLLIQRE